MSFSRGQRLLVLITLGVTAALAPVSTDLLAPSLPQMTEDFHSTPQNLERTIYSFLLGYGLAPYVWGRLSDNFGRKPIMLAGMAMYCTTSVLCALTANAEQLIMLRFIHGASAAAGATVSRAIIRDIYGEAGATKGMAKLVSVMAAMPLFMPLLGGAITEFSSWEMSFIAMAVIGVLGMSVYWLFVPESLPPKSQNSAPARISVLVILRNPRFNEHVICNTFCIATMVLFGANFSFILANDYQFNSVDIGIAMAVFNGAIALGTQLVWLLMPRYGAHRSILIGGALCAIGWLTISTQAIGSLPAISAITAPMIVSCLGCGIVIALCSGSALSKFKHGIGTASSIYLLIQSVGASGISFMAGELLHKDLFSMSTAAAGCGIAAVATKHFLSSPEKPYRAQGRHS